MPLQDFRKAQIQNLTINNAGQIEFPLESNTDSATVRLKPSLKEYIYRRAEMMGKKAATYHRELLELGLEYETIKHATLSDLAKSHSQKKDE